MAHQVFDRADVSAGFEEVGCEAVAQNVGRDVFWNAAFLARTVELACHGILMQVMAGAAAKTASLGEDRRDALSGSTGFQPVVVSADRRDALSSLTGGTPVFPASATRRWRKCWRTGETGCPSDGMSDGGVIFGIWYVL